MRIVWKDSGQPSKYQPVKYRKHFVCGTPNGWITDIPGDENLYKNHYCAKNAVDAFYGDLDQCSDKKRKRYGIQIIGKRNGESA